MLVKKIMTDILGHQLQITQFSATDVFAEHNWIVRNKRHACRHKRSWWKHFSVTDVFQGKKPVFHPISCCVPTNCLFSRTHCTSHMFIMHVKIMNIENSGEIFSFSINNFLFFLSGASNSNADYCAIDSQHTMCGYTVEPRTKTKQIYPVEQVTFSLKQKEIAWQNREGFFQKLSSCRVLLMSALERQFFEEWRRLGRWQSLQSTMSSGEGEVRLTKKQLV